MASDKTVAKAFEKFNRQMRKRKPRQPKTVAERAERNKAIQARIDELVCTHSIQSLAALVTDLEMAAGVLEGWDM